jgi:hypothetical protein
MLPRRASAKVLINGFLLEMQNEYDRVTKPTGSLAGLSKLFDFEFVTHRVLTAEAVDGDVDEFLSPFTSRD